MDELIIRSLQGRTTPEEEERLAAWRARDAANERRYRALRGLWSLTGVAVPGREEDTPDVGALIARAEATEEAVAEGARPTPATAGGRTGGPAEPVVGRHRSLWRNRTVAGALAAGLAALSFGLGVLADRDDEGPALLSESEVITGAGEMTTLTLADGSSIRLGPESRLRLAEEEDRRLAWLEGRAFFGVRADSSRPFIVHTDYGEAQVLGTRFEVRTEAEEFRVLVVEGAVSVSAGGAEVSVTDGELSRSVRGGRPSTERVEDVYQHLDWIGNAIVFQATPLDRALGEIERRYGVRVTLEDPALAGLAITAAFTGQSIEEVILVVCEIVGARCVIEEDEIRIGAAGSGRPAYAGRP